MFVFRSALRKGAASVRFYKSKPKMLRYDSKLTLDRQNILHYR
jgi:hypothetical protein